MRHGVKGIFRKAICINVSYMLRFKVDDPQKSTFFIVMILSEDLRQ